jgi:hypothetical protein
MRILALQTDFDKLKEHFISSDEREIMTAHFHWFKFFGAFMWCGLLTIISIVLAIWVPLEFQVSSMGSLKTASLLRLYSKLG